MVADSGPRDQKQTIVLGFYKKAYSCDRCDLFASGNEYFMAAPEVRPAVSQSCHLEACTACLKNMCAG